MRMFVLVVMACLFVRDARAEAAVDPCAVAAESGGQATLNACAMQKFHAAEQELQDVLSDIRSEYACHPLFLKKLSQSHSLWRQWRDAELETRFPVEEGTDPKATWGSSFAMTATDFMIELTHARTAYLRQWLDGREEGDLSAGSIRWKHQPPC